MEISVFSAAAPKASASASFGDFSGRKRVGKACDACRIKKSKCDGRKPCSRCIADDKICVFTDRKRSIDKLISASYVELLESRVKMLQQGIEQLVQHINRGDNINTLLDADGKININNVLGTLSLNCDDSHGLVELSRRAKRFAGPASDDDESNEDLEFDSGSESSRTDAKSSGAEDEPAVKRMRSQSDSVCEEQAYVVLEPTINPSQMSAAISSAYEYTSAFIDDGPADIAPSLLSSFSSLSSSPVTAPSFTGSPSSDFGGLLHDYERDLQDTDLSLKDLQQKSFMAANDVWLSSLLL